MRKSLTVGTAQRSTLSAVRKVPTPVCVGNQVPPAGHIPPSVDDGHDGRPVASHRAYVNTQHEADREISERYGRKEPDK